MTLNLLPRLLHQVAVGTDTTTQAGPLLKTGAGISSLAEMSQVSTVDVVSPRLVETERNNAQPVNSSWRTSKTTIPMG